ncbi:MAG TPA: lipopolysaccharide heptosyltransferase II [Ktedonobacterales bacterium]|nr:lipopolysaccharide heptosyltransferase II [Ktedonobacterales bacterium]
MMPPHQPPSSRLNQAPTVAHPPSPFAYDQRPALAQRLASTWGLRAKHIVQRLVYAGLAGAGLLSGLRIGRTQPLRPGDPRIRRILVIRVDLIGDVVLSLPAIQALRQGYPNAAIDLLVLPATAAVLEGASDIARVLVYDPNIWRSPAALCAPRNWRAVGRLVQTLRAARYDLCLSVAGDWASVLAWISGARRRVGYAGEAYPGLMTDPVPGRRYARREHEVEYVHRLARAAGGIVTEHNALPALHIPDPTRHALLTKLAVLGVPRVESGGALVVLHAGAQNGSAKRWPAASWAALADRLAAHDGIQVIFTGAATDRPLVAAIRDQMREAHVDLSGATTLAELAALLALADLVISGDSGPLHIACAVDTPVIGLYGPTDPLLSGPLGPHALVLRHTMWCAPCYDASATAECRFGNPVCMKSLSPLAVYQAACRQLRRRAAAHATTPAFQGAQPAQ